MHVYDVVGADGQRHFYLSPLSPAEAKVIGALPREAILGEILAPDRPAADVKIDPAQFRPNPAFLPFLHGVLAQHAHLAPGFAEAAAAQQDGYLYIVDARTMTPKGHVPVEDILGGVELAAGAAVRFHAMDGYRTVTERGAMRLHPWMLAKLVEELKKLAP